MLKALIVFDIQNRQLPSSEEEGASLPSPTPEGEGHDLHIECAKTVGNLH